MPYKQMPLNYVVKAKYYKQIAARFLNSKDAKNYAQSLANMWQAVYIVEGKNYDGTFCNEEFKPIKGG